MENKKELNNNEIEKVSGGNSGEQKDGSRSWINRPVMEYGGPRPIPCDMSYGGPCLIDEKKFLEIIRKKQNKDKEEPEKGKLSE